MIHRSRGADCARQKLEELLSQQGAILQNRKQSLRGGQRTETSPLMDVEERSQNAEEQGVGFSVLELTSQTVQGIETALHRLEAGVLGTCSDCRCRIGDARLRALPFAARCLACQQRYDIAAVAGASQATAGRRERLALTRMGSMGH